jgi:hypothetical protein
LRVRHAQSLKGASLARHSLGMRALLILGALGMLLATLIAG